MTRWSWAGVARRLLEVSQGGVVERVRAIQLAAAEQKQRVPGILLDLLGQGQDLPVNIAVRKRGEASEPEDQCNQRNPGSHAPTLYRKPRG